MSVRIPKPASLRRYGLTRRSWLLFLKSQNGVCAICKKMPPSGRMCTDHEHVPGWKKMSPQERRRFVRGVLCWRCNVAIVGRGVTMEKLYRAFFYLKHYETIKGCRGE